MLITYTIIVIYCYVFLSFCFSLFFMEGPQICPNHFNNCRVFTWFVCAFHCDSIHLLDVSWSLIAQKHEYEQCQFATCWLMFRVVLRGFWIDVGITVRRPDAANPSRHVTSPRHVARPNREPCSMWVKTIMNYPPNHNFYRWYKHWQMGGLFLFYPHYRYLKSSAIRPCFMRFENMTPAELRAVAKSLRPGTRVRKSYLCHGDLNHKNWRFNFFVLV